MLLIFHVNGINTPMYVLCIKFGICHVIYMVVRDLLCFDQITPLLRTCRQFSLMFFDLGTLFATSAGAIRGILTVLTFEFTLLLTAKHGRRIILIWV